MRPPGLPSISCVSTRASTIIKPILDMPASPLRSGDACSCSRWVSPWLIARLGPLRRAQNGFRRPPLAFRPPRPRAPKGKIAFSKEEATMRQLTAARIEKLKHMSEGSALDETSGVPEDEAPLILEAMFLMSAVDGD